MVAATPDVERAKVESARAWQAKQEIAQVVDDLPVEILHGPRGGTPLSSATACGHCICPGEKNACVSVTVLSLLIIPVIYLPWKRRTIA